MNFQEILAEYGLAIHTGTILLIVVLVEVAKKPVATWNIKAVAFLNPIISLILAVVLSPDDPETGSTWVTIKHIVVIWLEFVAGSYLLYKFGLDKFRKKKTPEK